MAVAVRGRPTEDERTDGALVEAVRGGENDAFGVLYARYRRRLAGFVYGMVGDWARAEDLTQEVFISALRRMRETERPIAFKPWVHEIAKNAAIDHFRRVRRTEEVSVDADEGLAPADQARLANRAHTPEAALERREQVDDLLGAFGGLSESHHDILVLREFEGLSYREIGERMSLSAPSVESTLFRARRRLGEEYDDLRSGRRCEGMRATIAAAQTHPLGLRERRRVRRHVAHCSVCRMDANRAGILGDDAPRRGAAKVAALLPFPLLGRRERPGGHEVTAGGASTGSFSSSVWRFGANVAPGAEPLGLGWHKVAAAVLAVAAVGGGAGVAVHESSRSAVPASQEVQRSLAPAPALFVSHATAEQTATRRREGARMVAGHARAIPRRAVPRPRVHATTTSAPGGSGATGAGSGQAARRSRAVPPLVHRLSPGAPRTGHTSLSPLAAPALGPVRGPSIGPAGPSIHAPPAPHRLDPAAVRRAFERAVRRLRAQGRHPTPAEVHTLQRQIARTGRRPGVVARP